MQIISPDWEKLIKDGFTLVVIPLGAAFIGAKFGADRAHEKAALAKEADELRKRTAIATALYYELQTNRETLAEFLLPVPNWDATVTAQVAQEFDRYLEFFGADTIALIAVFRHNVRALTTFLKRKNPHVGGASDVEIRRKALVFELARRAEIQARTNDAIDASIAAETHLLKYMDGIKVLPVPSFPAEVVPIKSPPVDPPTNEIPTKQRRSVSKRKPKP